jgi:PAS domain-containing protein
MSMEQQGPEPSGAHDVTKVEKIIELVKRLCLAESMCRIYGAAHPNARESIHKMFEWVNEILTEKHEVIINMAEGKVVVEGMPADERNPMIAKFAKTFNTIHADNLFFEEGLTLEECERFYGVLSLGPRHINAEGGLQAMLEKHGITHIAVKQISYVMVREDEKVVARDAQVIDEKVIEAAGGDKELVEYMVQQVLKRAEERKWLINEIKNNPKKMADMITQGIELAVSRSDSGLSQEKTIEGLLENIKMVGQSMVEENAEGSADAADLQEAVMTLESEVRSRSQKLMSSETAVGFINEVLTVITSYTDRVKAKQLSDEILKGERSLKQAEKLLQHLAPQEVSSEQFLMRIRSMLVDRGITEDQLMALAEGAAPKKKPTRPRKPRVVKPIADEIAKRLKSPALDGQQKEEVAAQLSGYFERELDARAKDVKDANRRLAAELALISHVLDRLSLGIIVWDADGVVDYIDQTAQVSTGLQKGNRLPTMLVRACGEWTFPIGPIPPETITAWGLTESDTRFLGMIDRVTKDADGTVIGALLKQDAAHGHDPGSAAAV